MLSHLSFGSVILGSRAPTRMRDIRKMPIFKIIFAKHFACKIALYVIISPGPSTTIFDSLLMFV